MRLEQILENYEVEVPIYRGLKLPEDASVGDIIPLTARQDRKPKDSSIMGSMLFNYGIQCRFGVSDVRKTSIFAACSYNIAKSYTAGVGRGVVQIIVPANSLVIYNRSVGDSLGILERRDVQAFILHMSKYIDDPTMDQYLSKNSGELFHDLVAEAVEDGEEFVELMRIFEDLAIEITDGYIAERAGEMTASARDSFECMVHGVSAYSGKILEIINPTAQQNQQQVDDDNIPF
ncbi:hypothetical protein D3C75_691130 [compost metagenome]